MIKEIRSHFKSCFPQEGCGVIIVRDNKFVFIPCKNIAPNKDEFLFDSKEYVKIALLNNIYAIVHSHINHPPYPSTSDRKYCDELALPFLIYQFPTMECYTLYPKSMDLHGRKYIWGIYDCLSAAVDWYGVHKRIVLKQPRTYIDDWWKVSKNNYLNEEGFREWGFSPTKDPRVGDIVVFQMGAKIPNHIGILLDNDTFFHHAHNRLSVTESLYPIWAPNIVSYYSYG